MPQQQHDTLVYVTISTPLSLASKVERFAKKKELSNAAAWRYLAIQGLKALDKEATSS